MSNYNSLKTTINANVKQNGNQEITGQILNSVLNQMVNTLGAGYQFAGVATTATDPGSPDAKVFYIANGKGTYTNFGGLQVTEDDVVVLYWDSSWHKVSTGIASQEKLSELEGKTTANTSDIEELKSEITLIKKGFDFSEIEIIRNEYVKTSDGSFSPFNGWSRTGFIRIAYDGLKSIKVTSSTGSLSSYTWLYDRDRKPLHVQNLSISPNVLVEDAYYIVISQSNEIMEGLSIVPWVIEKEPLNLESLETDIDTLETKVDELSQDVKSLIDDGYKFGGVVKPSDSPLNTDVDMVYFASQNGIYPNFDNLSVDNEIVAFIKGKPSINLLDLSTLIDGVYINENSGEEEPYANWSASPFIKIEAGSSYKCPRNENGAWVDGISVYYGVYDSEKNCTSHGRTTSGKTTIATSERDMYIRVSFSNTRIAQQPMLVPSDYNVTEYIEPSSGSEWRKMKIADYGIVKDEPQIILPSKLVFLKDKQFDIMVDNILYRGSVKDTGFKRCGSSTLYCNAYEDRYRINQPNVINNGSATLSMQIGIDYAYDKIANDQSNVLTKAISYTCIPTTQGSGMTKNVLFIGDSQTARGTYPNEVKRLFDEDSMNVTLLGTLGTIGKHEGRGGWSAKKYCTMQTYNSYTNAFWNPSTSKFDFAYYMEQNGYSGVDFVFINLGGNDVTDEGEPLTTAKLDSIMSYYNEMITSIRAYNSSIKIFIGLTILPATSTEDKFTLSLNSNFYKAIRLGLISRLIQTYGNRENEGFMLVPLYCVVDSRRDFPTELRPICDRDDTQVEFVTDMVHAKTQAYLKMADVIFTYIKYGTTL